MFSALPPKQGLYDPQFEHDACGVGFVVDIAGRKSNDIVRRSLQVLVNLQHRGAKGCEANTGDGAGILLQIPHDFLKAECGNLGFDLPAPGSYGVGMVCVPRDSHSQQWAKDIIEAAVSRVGQKLLGWRNVPTNNSPIGESAKAVEPIFKQVFVGRNPYIKSVDEFERKLYLIRKRIEKLTSELYFSSFSARTLIYKGMLSAEQIEIYFPDLADSRVASALAVVHQRFSTNTFPSWSLAHPFRYISHNGEINTLRGNINWMKAREALFHSELFGEDIKDLLPVIVEGGSDSAMIDNALEMLIMCGRSLPHAMMMLIPEAWDGHETMSDEKKAFYEYHSCLMEPWDGPASMVFSDGVSIGAVLDRNGLRPSRYCVTRDGLVVMASEVGVLDIPAEQVVLKGRLQPGKMLLIDTREGRIIDDTELKHKIAAEKPYRQWLNSNMARLADLPAHPVPAPSHETVLLRQQVYGYTHEDLRLLMGPMAKNGEEPVGSMGTDTPLAVLSDRQPPLFNYFKQLFAQVTNPPLDAIREELVTSMSTALGPEQNLLNPVPESCRMIKVLSPIMDNDDLAKLRYISLAGFRAVTLPMSFKVSEGGEGMRRALHDLFEMASTAIKSGATILILSDRHVDKDYAPIPSLLATSGLHHHLVREGTRTKATLIVETGDAREVHHYCLLIGYGASAINPYLAFETLDDMIRQGLLTGIDHRKAVNHYTKAVKKGVLKVMSKMGISTLQSYRGAQIFEAIGLDQTFVDTYFTNTPSRIGGIGLEEVAAEAIERHHRAFPARPVRLPDIDWGGQYQWRNDGEYHMYNPESIHKLQYSTRSNNYKVFKEYSELINSNSARLCTLRGLMDLKFSDSPIPLDQVEPVESIMKRFATGAMSFGSISREAHETLAIAMNRIGGRSNTGEGGEDPARYIRDENGDSRSSAIKQVASARFGVTSEYLVSANELQIKMAQGAKPGEGGQLPGHKVDEVIARVRHSTPGVGLISPPPHHDIYSIEDLAQLIYDLKNSNPRARISVKLVAEVGVGTIAAGVAKAHADVVLISGDSGGTGASPLTSIKHAGIPWELGLAETHQVLVQNNLRSRIVVQTDGQLKTGRDVIVAALLGAEEFGFATSALIVSGCIMMRVCHLNTCPVGVATQDPVLRQKFTGKPEYVVNYFRMIAEEVRELMAQLGFRTVDEMVGRRDKLDMRRAIGHWKAKKLDLTPVLYMPRVPENVITRRVHDQDHGLDKALDNRLLELAKDALDHQKPVELQLPIRNANRTVGTILGSEITRRYGAQGLPDGTISIRFAGSAGQSFGAFIPRGLNLTLEGDANDYFGKGLSGGRIVVFPPASATFKAEENIVIGNVALYGATSGETFIRGIAGERFAVRNSGATTIVEGVGDHGCEYMTGGRVVVLGHTGRNFAAGMSGGVAYVVDENSDFAQRCNLQMVDLERLEDPEEASFVRNLVTRHFELTKSTRAQAILDNWTQYREKFVKVMPLDYRRVLEQKKEQAAKTFVMVQHG
jgi:glutamate synthase (ferredoxin)